MVPPVVNDFIALFKDTSVCSVVTLVELTKRFSVLSQSTQATAELMALTGVLYLLDELPAVALVSSGSRLRAREGRRMIDVRGLHKRHGIARGPARPIAFGREGRGGGDHRPVGRRQVDAAPLHQRPRAVRAGRGPRRRGRALRRGEPEDRARACSSAIRKRVGFVFQQFNLFPHLDVLGNLIEAPIHVLGRSRDEAVAEAERLLDAGRAGGTRSTRISHELSGGQQQRVAIARALAMRPEVLLLDEPTSALDPLMAGEVMSVISDLAKAGQTMIVVTHQLGLVRAVADTVHVFAEGRRAEHGPTEAVCSGPAARDDAGVLAAACGLVKGGGGGGERPGAGDQPISVVVSACYENDRRLRAGHCICLPSCDLVGGARTGKGPYMPTDAIQCKPLEVAVADRGIERAIKQLKRKMATEGIMKELKRRRQYMKPSVKRRKKAAEAARRRRKRARMEAGLISPAPPRTSGGTRE